MPLAFWLNRRPRGRRRCQSRRPLLAAEPADAPRLRCALERDHERTGRTAFERQHRAGIGSDVKFWP